MDANSCRILLVALTATFTIAFNFPWEAAGRRVNQRLTEFRRRSGAARPRGRLSNLPWPQIVGAKYAVVVPVTPAPAQQPTNPQTTFYN